MSAAAWVRMPLKAIKPNPDNPRVIRDEQFQKLVRSIQEFPEMLELRSIVVNAEHVVLGGNMRLRACEAAGLVTVPVIRAETLTPEQQREFVVKDNVGFGDWDWEALANQWTDEPLAAWGLDVPREPEDENKEAYTAKIRAPVYEMTRDCPTVAELLDDTKRNALVADIQAATGLSKEIKAFLLNAAQRHLVFDYAAIAEFYAHASPTVQRLMEASALVIIDFDQAIANGFVQLNKDIREAMLKDYAEDEIDAGV